MDPSPLQDAGTATIIGEPSARVAFQITYRYYSNHRHPLGFMPHAHPQSKPRPRKSGPGHASRSRTRITVRIDRAKLQRAQRILGLTTATETIDAALDAITFRLELMQGIDRMRAAGGLTADSDD
jgi:hypothetical protein